MGIVALAASSTWPARSSAGSGSSNQPSVEIAVRVGAPARFGHRERLVGVHHHLERVADRRRARRTAARRPRRSTACRPSSWRREIPAPSPPAIRRPAAARDGAASRLPSCRPARAVARRRRSSTAAAARAGTCRSHSAVSIAASARLVIAPTAVACVAKKRSFQIASISLASRPISRGARWSRSSATTDEPPVPIVYV